MKKKHTIVVWSNLCVWRKKSPKKRWTWTRKKMLFHQNNSPCHKSTKTITKYTNYTPNCFCSHSILQIWLPATITCSQTSKKSHRTKIWIEWRSNRGMETILINKVEFYQIVILSLVFVRTFQPIQTIFWNFVHLIFAG